MAGFMEERLLMCMCTLHSFKWALWYIIHDFAVDWSIFIVPSFDGEIFSDALHYLAYKFVIIKLNRDRKTYRKYDLILELDRFIREESYLSTTHK